MTKREIKFRWWDGKRLRPWEEIDFYLINDLSNVEQYTGLKDVNGVEIYEGDIMWDAHHEVYGEISFIEGSFRYEEGDVSELLEEVNHTLEVIGNIHENPELLEVK